jgi:DNA-directed RNA polymerase specialized sigma24 family protein
MKNTTVNADEEVRRHLEQVFDKYHSRLQRYFLVQIGNLPEADVYVQETIYRFFDLMEGRQWEQEVNYINAHLMRIAFGLCMQKQTLEKSRVADNLDLRENQNCPFNKLRDESLLSIKERLLLKQFILRSDEEARVAA